MIINIRGTNGSGKTTLARSLIEPDPVPVDLVWYHSPTKKDPERRQCVEGWGNPGSFIAIGSYRQGCGGMDTVPSFDLQQQAVRFAAHWPMDVGRPSHVICEGVLASTVAGSWLEFFQNKDNFDGHEVVIAYLDTPLELCLERIKARQIASGRGEREIKTELVAAKIKSIAATRAKFDAAGIRTVTLNHDRAEKQIREMVR